MKTITMAEFRKQPGEYIRAVRLDGTEFMLTFQGKPVARLVPTEEDACLRVARGLRAIDSKTKGKDAVEVLIESLKQHGGRLPLPHLYRILMAKRVLALGVEVEDIIKDAGPKVQYDSTKDEVRLVAER